MQINGRIFLNEKKNLEKPKIIGKMETFNEKWKPFLGKGHYGLAFSNNKCEEYLNEIFEELTKIHGFEYYQIKLKFNNVRFYTNLSTILGRKIGFILEQGIEKELQKLYENG